MHKQDVQKNPSILEEQYMHLEQGLDKRRVDLMAVN